MFKRYFLVSLCCFALVSCEFFKKKELPQDVVVDTIVDYKAVDVFPLFPSCDSIPSQEKQRICSQIKLSESLYASLSKANIITSRKVNDTILISLKIDNNGLVSLKEIIASEFIQKQIPSLDSLIVEGVQKLPQLSPAIKRGIPVTTEFQLPIIVMN